MDALIIDKLKRFSSIDFMDMDFDTLFANRRDIKYVISIDRLDGILEDLVNNYDILVRDGKGYAKYNTAYFDTNQFGLYHDHHNGKGHRNKLRLRTYEDGASFLEVKRKSNTGLTLKHRVPIERDGFYLGKYADFIQSSLNQSCKDFSEKLEVTYQRITFYSRQKTEKITLDVGLTYKLGDTVLSLEGLLLGESKGMHQSHSFFNNYMRQARIHSTSFSKYCYGIANLEASVKSNNFKPLIRQVQKIIQSNAITSNIS